jgi:LacI family transcriptional regulator
MKKITRRAIMRRRRRVALLIDFSRAYGRAILLGVAKFVREHHEWSVQSEEWRWTDGIPAWFRNWTGDGAIVWVETQEQADIVRQFGVPAVDVRGSVSNCRLPLIDTENQIVANLAAEDLMQRGFQNYAFCGFVSANYSDIRGKFFKERLAREGFPCAVYQPPEISMNVQTLELEKRGLLFQEHLAQWLKSLPKPVGVMACNDIRGQQVMNACRRCELTVPEELAVIGVDNDEIFCELSDPPLSSVALDTVRIGYEAAALLERMMAGEKAPEHSILIPPLGVVARRSTDVLVMDDRQLAIGARFLREHAFDSITVNDAARAAGMSRRVFERRFATQMGRAPKAEVLRIRLERAKSLLANTDWPLTKIAERTGFKHGGYLHAVFGDKTGMTPGQFRKRAKLETKRHWAMHPGDGTEHRSRPKAR